MGEIENAIEQSGLAGQSVVIARADNEGNKRLISYVVISERFDKQGIIAYLQSKLPEYMVPALWVELESMPLTPNGKIDKKALPDPDASELTSNEYVAPQTELEAKMAVIWEKVLQLERVGVNTDFFELGGHSLLAMRLVSAIRKEMEVELAIRDVFVYPTIARLSAHVATVNPGLLLPPVEVLHPRPERIPLSFSQERLWFIDKLEGSVHYHVPAVLRLKGKLNKEALANSLQTIVSRHEVLRTVFKEEEGEAWQEIKDAEQWQLNQTNKSDYATDQEGLQQYIQERISDPFDLSRDNMLRAELIRIEEEYHVLIVVLHHIASDGWSRSILVKEVAELYAAYDEKRSANLPSLPVQYADYALWQRNYFRVKSLRRSYSIGKTNCRMWRHCSRADYVRPAIQSTRGASKGFKIDKELTLSLHQLSQEHGVTLFMTLLAAFKVLLYRYSGQQDICVGTPIAGRQQQELEGSIGFFLNTLALRSKVEGELSFIDLLSGVKTSTLEAYEHQEVPFEKVVDAVVKERDMSRSPLFQVMFVLQNTPEVEQLRLGGLQLSAEGSGNTTAKFEITLSITQTGEGLFGTWEYNTDLYSADTVERMITHYKELDLLNSSDTAEER